MRGEISMEACRLINNLVKSRDKFFTINSEKDYYTEVQGKGGRGGGG